MTSVIHRILFLAWLLCASTTLSEGAGLTSVRSEGSKLIVFVHGFNADSAGTWTNPDVAEKPYWPYLVRDDERFADFAIYTYDYWTDLSSGSPKIQNIARDLKTALGSEQLGEFHHIVFIAHSLGGIVVRQMLVDSPEFAAQVDGLILFASPIMGSDLAELIKGVTNNKTLFQLGTGNHNADSFLSNLRRSWRKAKVLRSIPSFCGFETLPTVGLDLKIIRLVVEVVKPEQAETMCNNAFEGIEGAAHNDTVRPGSAKDAIHRLLWEWMIGEPSTKSESIFPDLSRDVSSGGVAVLDCSGDTYGEAFFNAVDERLQGLGVSHYTTKRLSPDWHSNELPLIWRGDPPKLIVAHYSCFQDKGRFGTGQDDRRKDFNNLLESLAPFATRVMVYSSVLATSTYDGKPEQFLKDQVRASILKVYSGDRSLLLWPIPFGTDLTSTDWGLFDQLVEEGGAVP